MSCLFLWRLLVPGKRRAARGLTATTVPASRDQTPAVQPEAVLGVQVRAAVDVLRREVSTDHGSVLM